MYLKMFYGFCFERKWDGLKNILSAAAVVHWVALQAVNMAINANEPGCVQCLFLREQTAFGHSHSQFCLFF